MVDAIQFPKQGSSECVVHAVPLDDHRLVVAPVCTHVTERPPQRRNREMAGAGKQPNLEQNRDDSFGQFITDPV